MLRVLANEAVFPDEPVTSISVDELRVFRVKSPTGHYQIVACDSEGEKKLREELDAAVKALKIK